MRSVLLFALALNLFSCAFGPVVVPPASRSTEKPPGDVCGALMSSEGAEPPVVPVRGAVRFVAFGDYGTGAVRQQLVARGIAREHRRRPFDFGLTLGDNFYEQGLDDLRSRRWLTDWEAPYGGLGVRFYATLGNHHHHGSP